MTLRHYFIVMSIGLALAVSSLCVVILGINPEHNPFWGPLMLYISLFFTVAGSYAILGFVWRVKILRQTDVVFRQVQKTFRQGCLFGAVVTGALILQHAEFLRWWIIFLIVIIAGSIELYMLSRKEDARRAPLPPPRS